MTKLAGLNLGLAIPTAMSNEEAGVESTSIVFTTAPSVLNPFSHVNNGATMSRLTGERWGIIQIYEKEEIYQLT
ncbi:hypothetical protein Clacol_009953 [Clathrus columnatus]|uniref:Uncharacterized protein n=1 Tax=Clathrus columnatus TaxID=1419009 RepID=A0AAV5AML7_9AGAM|nr:hypothetical protein Clacol_009953 [Clathrus columnatus]